jgi:hypothetical protein
MPWLYSRIMGYLEEDRVVNGGSDEVVDGGLKMA